MREPLIQARCGVDVELRERHAVEPNLLDRAAGCYANERRLRVRSTAARDGEVYGSRRGIRDHVVDGDVGACGAEERGDLRVDVRDVKWRRVGRCGSVTQRERVDGGTPRVT